MIQKYKQLLNQLIQKTRQQIQNFNHSKQIKCLLILNNHLNKMNNSTIRNQII